MTEDNPLKSLLNRVAAGEPVLNISFYAPLTISIGTAGEIQIDGPLGVPGVEQAGKQRARIMVPVQTLRIALQALENNPGTPIVLSERPLAN